MASSMMVTMNAMVIMATCGSMMATMGSTRFRRRT